MTPVLDQAVAGCAHRRAAREPTIVTEHMPRAKAVRRALERSDILGRGPSRGRRKLTPNIEFSMSSFHVNQGVNFPFFQLNIEN